MKEVNILGSMTPSRPPKEYNHKSEFPQFSGQQQFQITLFRPGFGGNFDGLNASTNLSPVGPFQFNSQELCHKFMSQARYEQYIPWSNQENLQQPLWDNASFNPQNSGGYPTIGIAAPLPLSQVKSLFLSKALHEQNLNYLSLHGQNSHPSFGNTDVGNVQSFGFRDKAVYSNHANHYSTNDIYTRLQMTNPGVYVNQTECFGSESGNPKSNLSRMDEIRKGKRPIQAVDDFNPILAFNGSSTLCAAECESPSSAFGNRNQFQAMPASQQQHEDREFDEEEFDALLEQFCKIQGSLPLSRKVHPEISQNAVKES